MVTDTYEGKDHDPFALSTGLVVILNAPMVDENVPPDWWMFTQAQWEAVSHG